MLAYCFLTLAICVETLATTLLAKSNGFSHLGYGVTSLLLYGISLALLSLTLKTVRPHPSRHHPDHHRHGSDSPVRRHHTHRIASRVGNCCPVYVSECATGATGGRRVWASSRAPMTIMGTHSHCAVDRPSESVPKMPGVGSRKNSAAKRSVP